jgi:hypothetical protein
MPNDGHDSEHKDKRAEGSQDFKLAHRTSLANRRQPDSEPNPVECCQVKAVYFSGKLLSNIAVSMDRFHLLFE